MSFLNIDWEDLFGRKARRKLKEVLEQKEQELHKEVEKPYLKAYYSNGIVTVVFKDGDVASGEGTQENYEWIKSQTDEYWIRDFFKRNQAVKEESKEVLEEMNKLVDHDLEILEILGSDFTSDAKGFYYKGITLPIPSLVLESMVEYKKQNNADMFQRMVYFFLLLATSPIEACRENVLRFCKKNDVRISKRGNIIAYRRVVKIKQNVVLRDFVLASYQKVKKNKKKPGNYNVWVSTDDQGYTEEIYLKDGKTPKPDGTIWVNEGNLTALKEEFSKPKPQMYTSWHNNGKYKFEIGDVYRLEGEEPDPNTGNCSSNGLHFGSTTFNNSGFGDTGVCVIVNPAKAIYVPNYEASKARTTEMKIACLYDNSKEHIDESLIEQADIEYADYTQEGLEKALKNKSFSNMSIKEEVPVINLLDLKTIQQSLKNRVVKV